MQNDVWQGLIDVFGKISLAYDSAVTLGTKKRDALVTIDMDGLSKLLDEENLLTAKIQKLERQRGTLLTELSKQEPSIGTSTKMEELFKLAPSRAIEDRLKLLHKGLSKKVSEAIKIKDNNELLAKGALQAVRYQLNRIGGATVETTYQNKGANIVTHRKNFDFKA